MKQDSHLEHGRPRRMWAPYFVLAVALLLTLLATYYADAMTEAKDRLQFQISVLHAQNHIQNSLETYVALLRAGSGLFAASKSDSFDEFRAYVERLDLRRQYPGIQGIGFTVRLRPEEKDALVAQMRRRVEDFKVWPEQERSEYHSIIYLEPLDRRNRAAIGYDMFTEPVRRAAMERARDTGLPAASGRVTLVQEIDQQKQAGFLIYVPVYRDGQPAETVAERQAALQGFVYSPFRAGDLLEGIFEESYREVDFQVYDGTQATPQQLLHDSHRDPHEGSYQPRFTATTNIDVAGHTWTLSFFSRPEFDRASGRGLEPYILLGGLIVSLVLFGVTWSQARAQLAAERAASDLRRSEEALRESERFARSTVDALFEHIAILEENGTIIAVNKAWRDFAGSNGVPAGKVSEGVNYLTVCDTVKGEDSAQASAFAAGIRAVRRGEMDHFSLEYPCHAPNKRRWFVGSVMRFPGEGPTRIVVAQENITERKRAEEAIKESEERYRELFENANDIIYTLDLEGNLVSL
ncbi:MAG TPA: CHASE domain-containing protein, partial [Pyrinomonadaceae bacterium]|nr:CHASE domain-containing protein [Pyrinomonadaceae bacterium]